ncbi:phosphoesterase [Maribacter sp. 2308TA10-17]|uniref:phosphoesterase n=1 Tax=Maribacter sp. 2308TA10-17 TaxID=3386276 RepID=UPI0039BC5BF3
MESFIKYGTTILGVLFFTSALGQEIPSDKTISHKFYLVGDVGEYNTSTDLKNNLQALNIHMQNSPTNNSTLLFLGNNFSKNSFEEVIVRKSGDDSEISQLIQSTVNNYKGETFFIPGDLDWHAGLLGLKKQEKFIDKTFGKGTFQPKNGCPLERIKINDDVDLLLIDSQWALMGWSNYPEFNEECDIKTKVEFYVELESTIKKSEGKTVLVATHHPLKSYGEYGERFSFGINDQGISNVHYKEFSDRLITIARQTNNVVFMSGHENNLQYFTHNSIPMIISGAGGSASRVSKIKEGFSQATLGFTEVTVYNDGDLWVRFYGKSNNYTTSLFNKKIITSRKENTDTNYSEYDTPEYVMKSIYKPEELERSGFYKALWGEHYRNDYATQIKIKTALLDTLYGGLTPMRKGGGHQTNSLRLSNKNGRQYALRSAKKSALRFVQYFLFKTKYLEADIEDTYFVQLLQDYWTTANAYGALTIGDLADAVGILHPNPELYYLPKQKALGYYNKDYGDKIYFIEERLSEGQEDVASLGNSDEIISTLKLFEELRKKENLEIDQQLYIRTRLFDNLVGDWDRHADQWKWAVTKKGGKTTAKPIPRDRDQVYSDFDGFILGAVTALSPPLRFMQRYDSDYNSVKWYNDAGDDVDLAVLKNHTQEDWIKEARFIKNNITPDIIEKAFANLPPEIDQEKVARNKEAFKGRLANIEENAINLYKYLKKCLLITGTDKKDLFVITRMDKGVTKIQGYSIMKNGDKRLFWDVDYNRKDTKEIWLYGLADKDRFEVKGRGTNPIHLKIIGGNGNDTYNVENRNSIKVYDHKTVPNTFETPVSKMLSDNYDMNTYYFKKHRRDISNCTPLFGYDPDNGVGLGLQYNYQKNSLVRNPFTDNHHIGLKYFFETSGVDVYYSGEFAHVFDKVNFGLSAQFTSPNFTNNFFGFGNETINRDDELDLDFNRVRIQQWSLSPSLIFRKYQGSSIKLGFSYEHIEVEKTEGRFIESAGLNDAVFEGQNYFGIQGTYEYDNLKTAVISKSGVGFNLTGGYKTNLDTNEGFGYINPSMRAAVQIDKKGLLIVATKLQGQINLGDDFEFFQAANLGATDGLRGFRQQRFTGKRAFSQSTDLRISVGKIRNSIIPISMGVYAGFDYGRVWIANDTSKEWRTSSGGGFYFSLGGFTALNLAYFNSDDGGRFTFGLSLPF